MGVIPGRVRSTRARKPPNCRGYGFRARRIRSRVYPRSALYDAHIGNSRCAVAPRNDFDAVVTNEYFVRTGEVSRPGGATDDLLASILLASILLLRTYLQTPAGDFEPSRQRGRPMQAPSAGP